MAQNCWEFLNCGRQPGGAKVGELGVCPASTFEPADGFAGGRNGGRACAYITGTFCFGETQGVYKDKLKKCVECDFYNHVKLENPRDLNVIHYADYVRDK